MKRKFALAMGIVATTGILMTGCGTTDADANAGAVTGAAMSGVENVIEETVGDIVEEETVMDEFETVDDVETEPTADAAADEVEDTTEATEKETDVTETAGEAVEEESEDVEGDVELPTDYTDGNTEGTIIGKHMKKAADSMKKFLGKSGR